MAFVTDGNGWMERAERMKTQAEYKDHLHTDIEQLLDQTENMRRSSGSGL